MKNKIEDLRNHLFETIEYLKDAEKPMDLDRARAIADVAQVIVNSAKIECEFIRTLGGTKGTGFVTLDGPSPALPQPRMIRGRAQSGSEED